MSVEGDPHELSSLTEALTHLWQETHGLEPESVPGMALSDFILRASAFNSVSRLKEALTEGSSDQRFAVRMERESELRIAEHIFAIHEARIEERELTLPGYADKIGTFLDIDEAITNGYVNERGMNSKDASDESLERFEDAYQI